MTLTAAEIVKLVRRRGLMLWATLLTLGPVVVAYTVLVILHAVDAERWSPAGGRENFENVIGMLALLGGVAGVILATTAGSQDRASGVFRDLVVTGRPRTALFLARVRGALAVYVPLVAVAFGLAVVASYAFAAGEPTLGGGDVLGYAAWIGVAALLNVVLGVSLGSMVSSRIAVGVLLAWNTILVPLLLQIDELGSARAAIDAAAAQHFAPAGAASAEVAISTTTALVVIALWTTIPLRIAASVTKRRDP